MDSICSIYVKTHLLHHPRDNICNTLFKQWILLHNLTYIVTASIISFISIEIIISHMGLTRLYEQQMFDLP